jgi:hypothetical protein
MTTKKPGRMDQNLAPCFAQIERSNQALTSIAGFAQKRPKNRQQLAQNAAKLAKQPKKTL